MSHHTIGVKVPVKVVQVSPAFEEEEQDQTDDANHCYTTYYTTYDSACVRGGGSSSCGCGLGSDGCSGVYRGDRDAIT
jgi:hypothetical protein